MVVWQELFVVIAMVMVWEGLLPTINPAFFRQLMAKVIQMNDNQLRQMGLVSMTIGAILLYLLKSS
ncbi:MAG: DUF2065 domain-containing protein [Gammaproteobacteria bacterium]|nr:DUF2065 domain-containing protein [Gammaproteobacteria bacterium]